MKIESGMISGVNWQSDWNLFNGSGDRATKKHISFAHIFSEKPNVVVSLYFFDIIDGQNHRLEVYAENVDRYGFDVVFKTWADTRVWGAGVSWIAYGDTIQPIGTVQCLPAKAEWMPMDMQVEADETLIIQAAGQWRIDSKPDTCWVTADGYAGFSMEGTALGTANLGSLIGRVGLHGTPFFVGSHFEQKCSESGILYLQMNDFPGLGMADNEGELKIIIKKVS